MSRSAQASSISPSDLSHRRKRMKMPGEDLTIAESLRVMDVARELRDRRVTAEEMFRHDRVRAELREKLMATARLSGDEVTEAEVDAAIDQYFANLHTYQSPPPGFKTTLAHLWIARDRIALVAGLLAMAAAWWFWF